MKQGSLLKLWMDENVRQQSNEKLLTKQDLQLLFDSTTKLARTAPTWGIEQVHSTCEVCWKYFCILSWFFIL